jgi:predicted Zn finger-like uncharacterized protein
MMRNSDGLDNSTKANGDLFFACEHCGTPFVVDRAAAGVTLKCQTCEKSITVPAGSDDQARAIESKSLEKLGELRRHLKENESQRTEVRGYINQLSIQLHRWQLRLQVLEERNKALITEMDGLSSGPDLR